MRCIYCGLNSDNYNGCVHCEWYKNIKPEDRLIDKYTQEIKWLWDDFDWGDTVEDVETRGEEILQLLKKYQYNRKSD